jgi:hypothetical protein
MIYISELILFLSNYVFLDEGAFEIFLSTCHLSGIQITLYQEFLFRVRDEVKTHDKRVHPHHHASRENRQGD